MFFHVPGLTINFRIFSHSYPGRPVSPAPGDNVLKYSRSRDRCGSVHQNTGREDPADNPVSPKVTGRRPVLRERGDRELLKTRPGVKIYRLHTGLSNTAILVIEENTVPITGVMTIALAHKKYNLY
jgi:hypothetical protein